MKGFKTFLAERQALEEGIVKKGAVAAYALQGRNHGNNAVRSYNKAKQTLQAATNAKSTDMKVDALTRALIDLLDGLVSQRQQIGSVSAQITSSNILK
jgi:hypothetical protein